MLKNPFLKFKALYTLTTHFDCLNSQVNNLDYMERKQVFFKGIRQYFLEKLKAGQEIYEEKLISSKYLKKHFLLIKLEMYNFMCFDEIRNKIRYITNTFLWL